MKILIIYYSLTGTTRTVVEVLAKSLTADLEEIRCTSYASGFVGFWRAAVESWRVRVPVVAPLEHNPMNYDLVVVAGPIWVFRPAPPIRAFFLRERQNFPRIALLLTHGGSAAERSVKDAEATVGKALIASIVLKEKDIQADRYRATLDAFADEIRRQCGDTSPGK